MILLKNISCKTYAVFIASIILLTGCASMEKAGAGPTEIPVSVKLEVSDTHENKTETGRASGPGGIGLMKSKPVAVLPVTNLSRVRAPLHRIRQLSIDMLKEQGFDVLDDGVLDVFMEQHRIRYVGGIDRATSRAFSWAGSIAVPSCVTSR